jgi:hypothetical protein
MGVVANLPILLTFQNRCHRLTRSR